MMNKRRIGKRTAFTLIELLVVISIIALLLAILMPALAKVKEKAEAVVCLNLIKQMALANVVYTHSCDGLFIAPGWRLNALDLDDRYWCWNSTFLSMVGMTKEEIRNIPSDYDPSQGGGQYGCQWPSGYLCPTSVYVKDNWFAHRVSYGYNHWDGLNSTAEKFPEGRILRPSEKLMFVDSQEWWSPTTGANYTTNPGWDMHGQTKTQIKPSGGNMGYPFVGGPVMYRHSEGTNVAYFDGSAGHRKKEETFYFIDDDPTQGRDKKRNDKLWVLFPTK